MTKMMINGQSVSAVSGKVLDVLSPIDGMKFEEIPRGDSADVDLAVKAANASVARSLGK
jgi:aldehyde dehydrogenase (NAD+)